MRFVDRLGDRTPPRSKHLMKGIFDGSAPRTENPPRTRNRERATENDERQRKLVSIDVN
jgi:hypothetical protein